MGSAGGLPTADLFVFSTWLSLTGPVGNRSSRRSVENQIWTQVPVPKEVVSTKRATARCTVSGMASILRAAPRHHTLWLVTSLWPWHPPFASCLVVLDHVVLVCTWHNLHGGCLLAQPSPGYLSPASRATE